MRLKQKSRQAQVKQAGMWLRFGLVTALGVITVIGLTFSALTSSQASPVLTAKPASVAKSALNPALTTSELVAASTSSASATVSDGSSSEGESASSEEDASTNDSTSTRKDFVLTSAFGSATADYPANVKLNDSSFQITLSGGNWQQFTDSSRYRLMVKLYGDREIETAQGDTGISSEFNFVIDQASKWLVNPQTGSADPTLWAEVSISTQGTISASFDLPGLSNLPDGTDLRYDALSAGKKLQIGLVLYDLQADTASQVSEVRSDPLMINGQSCQKCERTQSDTYSCTTSNLYTEAHVEFSSGQNISTADTPVYYFGDRVRLSGNGWCNRTNQNQRLKLSVRLDNGRYRLSNQAAESTWVLFPVVSSDGTFETYITLPSAQQSDSVTGLKTYPDYPAGTHTLQVTAELLGSDGDTTGTLSYQTNPFKVQSADDGIANAASIATTVVRQGIICYPQTTAKQSSTPATTTTTKVVNNPTVQKAKPNSTPAPPVSSPDQLTESNAGGLVAVQQGTILVIDAPSKLAVGDWVFVYAWSPETPVGWVQIGQDRVIKVDIANMDKGEVKVALISEDGQMLGWVSGTSNKQDSTPLRKVSSGTVKTVVKHSEGLSQNEIWLLAAAGVALLAVLINAVLLWTRKRHQRQVALATRAQAMEHPWDSDQI